MMNFYTVICIMLDNLRWKVEKYAANNICGHMAKDKM